MTDGFLLNLVLKSRTHTRPNGQNNYSRFKSIASLAYRQGNSTKLGLRNSEGVSLLDVLTQW
ncbi:hypothetical protein O9929_12545 [Vibrio lentus]|nr:hypothetical protein [Vibrio lentus]